MFRSDEVFATTHWSVVLAARGDSPPAREALGDLCRRYWYPVYCYVRRRGYSHDQAEDLTQEFFVRLLARKDLEMVDSARGRFRSFLLAACRNFLCNQHDHACALKRGGGRRALPLDLANAEGRYAAEPADQRTPDRLFERRWALSVLQHALEELRGEYADDGKAELFDRLEGCLTGAAAPYAEVAAALGTTEGAVKVAAHRLRQRYGERLRQLVAQTVADPEAVEDEIRTLFLALG